MGEFSQGLVFNRCFSVAAFIKPIKKNTLCEAWAEQRNRLMQSEKIYLLVGQVQM